MTTRSLLTIAVVLIIVWVLATVTKFLVGTLLNLLLVAALILLVLGAIKRIRQR